MDRRFSLKVMCSGCLAEGIRPATEASLHEIACIRCAAVVYKNKVKFWTATKRQHGVGKCAIAGLMFSLWFGTVLLAVSPQLHQLLHSDARNPDHHCLVTQIKEHSMLSSCSAVALPAPPPKAIGPVPCAEFRFPPAKKHRLTHSRAPPSPFSSVTVED